MSGKISVHNISKRFDGHTVFSELSLTFPAGEITSITGPSGCGKTTLLRILAGLEAPNSGEIKRDAGSIAFVFQEDRLSEDFTAVSNIRLVCGKTMTAEEIRRHLAEIGLSEDLDKPLRDYSGGMKRRVAIARAICYNADYLLMDEPFKGLDEALKIKVMDYVKRHSQGKTVIFVTHDPEEAEYMGGNRIAL